MDGGLIYVIGLLLALVLTWLVIEGVRSFKRRRLFISGNYHNLTEAKHALEHFSRHLERDPHDWETHIRRGEAFAFLNDHQQAIRDYTRALALHPNDESVLLYRSRSYCKLHQYDEAIWDCTRALDINSHYIPAYSMRGQAYFESNEYERAARDYTRAIEMDSDNAQSYLLRGYYYLRTMELELAESDLQRSWNLRAYVPTGLMLNWLKLARNDGQKDEEIACELEKIARLNPKSTDARICQGIVLYLRGAYDQALARLKQAESTCPANKHIYFWQGMVLASQKHGGEANLAFSRTSDLGLPRALWQPIQRLDEQIRTTYKMYGI